MNGGETAVRFLRQRCADIRYKKQLPILDQFFGKLSKLALRNADQLTARLILGLKTISNKSLCICIPDFDLQEIGRKESIEILKNGTENRFQVEAGGDGLAKIGNNF